MKYPLAIFAAAAAVVAGLIRSILGDSDSANHLPPPDPTAASSIPPITPHLVERLAFAGGTDAEIADRFLVEPEWLATEYHNVLRVARAMRKLTIRGLQLDAAKKLNASILTWLGRNELGQSIKPSDIEADEPHVSESQMT